MMVRASIDYSDRYDVQAIGFDPDTPIAGFYRFRMRSGGALCGVRIWHGAPLDPVTGEELDRSHRWQAQVNDDPVLLERVWPKCAADAVDEAEYQYLCAVQAWAKENAPDSPQANLMQRINPLTSLVPF
jgi:hypothetical protein